MNSASSDRELLKALLAALEDPARAAAFRPDDAALMAVAQHHRLTPLLSIACGETLPVPLAEACRRDRIVTAARNMILGQVAEECIRALAETGVRTIVLKGLDYETRLYRSAGARPTADVDILVPDEKRRAAFTVLDRLGFEPRAAAPGFDDPDYHEVAWTRAGVEVDLHMALAPLARCRIDYARVWREAEPFRMGQTDAWVLAPTHAAIFHSLHMAIDHFDVPAIYLIDLARLVDRAGEIQVLESDARLWRCHRALATSMALAGAFLPHENRSLSSTRPGAGTERVLSRYGTISELPRPEQIVRKYMHFDSVADAIRYTVTQSRRIAKEWAERSLLGRSARERLAL